MPAVNAEQLLAEKPEIFEIKPRSGGIINVEEIKQPCKPEETPKKKLNPSRQHRIEEVLKKRVAAKEDDAVNLTAANVAKNSMDMLAVTISTVMLMASGAANISRDHLIWTTAYLKSIVNEFGDHPPNVQGILNYIHLTSGDLALLIEGGGEDPDEGPEGMAKTIRTITTVQTNAGNQSVVKKSDSDSNDWASLKLMT